MADPTRLVFALLAAVTMVPVCVTAQQHATMTGRVTSESGAPLGNASVFIENTRVGSATSSDGRYTLTLPATVGSGTTLIISARLIGYRKLTKSLTLQGDTLTVDFALTSVPFQLSEVVVTGEGTATAREKLGSAVSSIETQDIVNTHEPNLVNAMAAQASNVEVTSQAGEPGAGASVLIRGFKSIEGTGQPLFVVDGSPVNNDALSTQDAPNGGTVTTNRIADVDPNDIATVEILKGAAASAIYGARAASGVVLITTKGGTAGQTRFELQTSYSFDNVTKGIPLQRTFGQGNRDSAAICTTRGCSLTQDSWGIQLPAGTPTYDHFGELFHTGHLFDASLAVSGGDAQRSFFLSAGWMDHQGTILGPSSHLDRASVRLKGTQALGSSLRLGGNVAYASSRANFAEHGDNVDGLLLGSTRTPPEFDNHRYVDPTNGQHRSYNYPRPDDITAQRVFTNPFWMIYNDQATNDLSRVFGNVNVEWVPLPWLTVKYWLGLDHYSEDRLEGYPPSSASLPHGGLYQGNYTNTEIDHNLIVVASRTFNPNASGSITIGQNLNSRHFLRVQDFGQDLASSTLAMSNAAHVQSMNLETLVHAQSFFAQLGLDLFDQLYMLAAIRDDGSSTFGHANPRSLYPKASVAWDLSRLIHARPWLIAAKVRAAYGEAGREPAPYQIFTGYAPATYAGNPGLVTSTNRGQDSLRPERTKEFEAGLDFTALKEFVDGSVTYYRDRTTDAIFEVPLPTPSGYGSQVRNAATIDNHGWELSLNLHLLRQPSISWDLGVMWARNSNTVLSLIGVPVIAFNDGEFASSVLPGFPVGAFYMFDYVRCRYGEANIQPTSLGERTDINAYCKAHGAPNGALFVDRDGYPIADNVAQHVVGASSPDWTGSVRTSFTIFRKVQISALVDVRHGGEIWNGTRGALYNFGTHKDTDRRNSPGVVGKDVLHGAVVGPGAGLPVALGEDWFKGLASGYGALEAQFVEPAGYTKLREIAIAYTWDAPFIRRATTLTSVVLRLAGRNLYTWSPYTGLDPEMSIAGPAVPGGGADWFNSPQTRSVVVSVALNR